ncbi:hypothetical protein C8R45DRAFT_813158 [Mycena sanguinolenta]|nr:hypothetical protein C8R45DRAFT_830605 [Mycena sanguinolenta]KAJ6512586.1 hypothetical protein C8R45DRAFT_813158 [Mycena sanguinolenta]
MCPCDACEKDRESECENPSACVEGADSRLRQLLPEWDPRRSTDPAPDHLLRAEGEAPVKEGEAIFHAPDGPTHLGQGLRILTQRRGELIERPNPRPSRRRGRPTQPAVQVEGTTVYVGTAVLTQSKKAPRAAASLFYGDDDQRNRSLRIPDTWSQNSYVAEFAAALEVVRQTSTDTVLTIVSTQEYVQKAMTNKLTRWEREGWVGVRHRDIMKSLAAALKARRAKTVFTTAAPGGAARERCRAATVAAKKHAESNRAPSGDLTVPKGTALPGIQLQGNRQKIFYKGIREEKAKSLVPRKSTTKNLDAVKGYMKEKHERIVTGEEIWRSLRNKDLQPQTSQFLWRSMHNAHRVGKYWDHIPECEERATCSCCGVTENLEHILVECESPGPRLLWKAAEKLWREKTTAAWPEVSLDAILGCGLPNFDGGSPKEKRGTQRMYRILMSETAYTIWLIRNDRVITRAGEPLSERAVMNKWTYAMNQRLQQDVLLAKRRAGRNRPRLPINLVTDTWAGVLDDEDKLPTNWLKEARVLVGRRAFTSDQLRLRDGAGVG